MSGPISSQYSPGFLYFDASATAYALQAGGIDLLDRYILTANANGFSVAITDVVQAEIASPALRQSRY
jgi:hypothetical protein